MLRKRLSSFLILIAFVIGSTGVIAPDLYVNADTAPEKVTVIAGSDFQNPAGNAAGQENVRKILDSVTYEGYEDINGLLFCGDYDYDLTYGETQTAEGVNAVRNTVEEVFGGDLDEVFIQGNHDSGIGTAGMSPGGNNDSDNYGVFVINEDDYMWYNSDENRIKAAAANLRAYLNGKRRAKYTKPIFVLSHLPLHYSMRTYYDGDGKYAHYIFDELNEAGAAGLNIIYLFGHDHSNGWDDYLGGSAIYLAKGRNILISDGTNDNYYEETLDFTYMNAGYTGYYDVHNQGACASLTMSVFDITADKIVVARFDESGIHDLKAAGVSNEYKNETANGKYLPDRTVVESPEEIVLNKEITAPAPEETKEPVSGRIYQRIESVSDIEDGDKILMIYNGSSFMLPEIKEVSGSTGVRVGFDIESAGINMDERIAGDFEKKEWTFNKSGSGWMIGSGGKYIKFTDTSDKKITATLESLGDIFTINGNTGSYTFTSGNTVLNYNEARKLLNGYESAPAGFCLYRYTGENAIIGNVCEHPRSQIIDAVQPTCTEKGFTGNEVCTNCGDIITAGKEIKATGHLWNEGVVTLAPTEISEGVRLFECNICGAEKSETIARLSGKATVNPIEGNDSGTVKKAVKLSPVIISSVKNLPKRTMLIKCKKNTDAAGYQIRYASKKNFRGKKTVVIKKAKTVSKKIKKLAKKKYFVKIRAYKIADGKKVYSEWSKIKTVRINK